MKLNYFRIFFLLINLIAGTIFPSFSQVNRVWTYSYSPPGNYESSGQGIIVLPSGKTITCGIYKSASGNNRNTLIKVDETGAFLDVDTSTTGSGYRKIIYDGHKNVFAAATLNNDSLPISKIVVAKFDTTFTNRQFFVPDSGITFPGYDVLDMAVLNNSSVVIASHWDAFPNVCLSLMCIDSVGTILWERVDSTYEFSYDVKLLADSSGGIIAAGSGRDTSTSLNFIFISHYTSTGLRDWTVRYNSSQSFAEMNDIIHAGKNIYMSGTVMDSTGQVGLLMKIDSTGNIIWNKPVYPLSYLRILTDDQENVYGTQVPQNGLDALKIIKSDSSGTIIDSISFQLTGYFTSDLGDFRMLENGTIAATGGLYVLSFPKSDLYFAAFDTALNAISYDIFNSFNQLGETGRSISELNNGSVYVCGRFNFENHFETSNIGVAKYNITGTFTGNKYINSESLLIFPNPSTGNITLRWPFNQSCQVSVRIFNCTGTEIFHDVLAGNIKQMNYNLNLKPGIYQVIVDMDDKKYFSKISISY